MKERVIPQESEDFCSEKGDEKLGSEQAQWGRGWGFPDLESLQAPHPQTPQFLPPNLSPVYSHQQILGDYRPFHHYELVMKNEVLARKHGKCVSWA